MYFCLEQESPKCQRFFSPCAAYSLVAPLAWLRELAYESEAARMCQMCSVTSSVNSRCTSTEECIHL
jgi:hypothetical protein